MWEQYRKNAVATQLFVITVCAMMLFFGGVAPVAVLVSLLVMEIGAVIGAAWGARLKRKFEARANRRLSAL